MPNPDIVVAGPDEVTVNVDTLDLTAAATRALAQQLLLAADQAEKQLPSGINITLNGSLVRITITRSPADFSKGEVDNIVLFLTAAQAQV